MITNQEYFTIELASTIILGIPLNEMVTVAQFEKANICTVPGVADFWHGVANFKGSLLWILDSDRFFNLKLQSASSAPKLTAVVVKNQLFGEQRVAIAAQHLKGIVPLETSSLQPISPQASTQIAECCSSVAHVEDLQAIYIINSVALLQKLHQQSMLVST